MLEAFLYVGLPYLALTVMIVGTLVRFRRDPYSVSSLSSQVLESKMLPFGSLPWHFGILVVLGGHVVAWLFPAAWRTLTANYWFLITVESIGIAAALLCIFGLTVLLYRRLTHAKLQAVTSNVDLLVLALLLVQVLLGFSVALTHRWGAQWSTGTTTPYLWSLFSLSPEMTYVSGMPADIKLHLSLAWVIFLLIPFSRLVHGFTVPLEYLWRAPQKVVWATRRRVDELAARAGGVSPIDSRRSFVRGAAGLAAAAILLGVGVLDKVVRYFKGHKLSKEEERKLLRRKLQMVEMTAHERALELERLESEYIFVANLGDLNPKLGKYFVDYQMRPALAFMGADGLPILLSAKCTHLGCTIAANVDEQGRILCPCHISYFDITTGEPNDGAPAKTPLPKIGWVIRNPLGEVVASRDGAGNSTGQITEPKQAAAFGVFIAKRFEDGGVG